MKKIISLSFVFTLISVISYAQTSMINFGTTVMIQEGAVLYIPGDYTDESTGAGAGIFLGGTMRLKGDLLNSRTVSSVVDNVFSDDGDETGVLILEGAGDQSIGGVDKETLLRNVNINVPSDREVILSGDVILYNVMTIVSGDVDLNGHTLTISDDNIGNTVTKYPKIIEDISNGFIVKNSNETAGRIYVERSEFDLDVDGAGAGLGIEMTFNENLGDFSLSRYHTSESTVADGVSILRSYKFQFSTNNIELEEVDIKFSDEERDGIAANTLGIYISDATNTWRELSDFAFSDPINGTNSISVAIGSTAFPLPANVEYTIAVATRTCTIAKNKTNYNFDTNDFIPTLLNDNEVLNICEDENVALIEVTELGSTNIYPSFSYWTGEYESELNSIEINGTGGVDIELTTNKTFAVKAINSYGCDTDVSFVVNERAFPSASFTKTEFICDGQEATFTNASTTATSTVGEDFETISYDWNFGDGSVDETSIEVSPTHTFPAFDLASTDNPYTVTLGVTSGYGCLTNISLATRIMPNPIFNFSFSDPRVNTDVAGTGANGYACEHDKVTFTVEIEDEIVNGIEYLGFDRLFKWTLSDIGSFEETRVITDASDFVQTLLHTYTAPNNANTVELTMEFETTQCATTMSVQTIPVKPTPEVIFAPKLDGAIDNTICVGQTVLMDNTSKLATVSTDGEEMIYEWWFGDETAVYPAPATAPFSTIKNPSKSYTSQSGTLISTPYEAILKVTSDTYGCYDTLVEEIVVYPSPTGSFIKALISGKEVLDCEDEEVAFENQSALEKFQVDGDAGAQQDNLYFTWYFEDLTPDQINDNKTGGGWQNVFHPYENPGVKTVTLVRETDFGCVNQETKIIEVYANPRTVFTAEAACVGESFEVGYASPLLSGYDAIISFAWDVEDIGTFDTDTIELLLNESKSYQVDLKATTLAGCDSTYSAMVSVSPRLIFNLSTIISCDEEIIIDPKSAEPVSPNESAYYLPDGTTYHWYNENGDLLNEDALLNPDFEVPQLTDVTASGAYTVVLGSASGISCGNMVTVNVEAVNAAVSFLESDGVTFCQEGTINTEVRTNQAAITNTYVWKDKNGDVLLGETNPSLFVTESGAYTVEVATTSSISCFSEATINVVIEEPLDLIFDDISVCIDEEVTLDAGVTGALYVWTKLGESNDVDDEEISTNQTVNVTEPAKYRVEVSKGECSSSGIVEVINFKPAQVDFSANALNFCKDTEITFSNQSTPVESGTSLIGYEWDFGDGTIINAINPQHTFAAAGNYDITLTIETSNNCVFDHTETITIYTLPDATFIPPSFCQNASAEFVGNSDASMTNSWGFGDGLYDEGSDIFHQYELATDYNVILTVESAEGCLSSSTEVVEIYEIPKYNTGGAIVTCGTAIELDASASGVVFSWKDNLGDEITASSSYNFTSDGSYSVVIENTNGCISEEFFDITLNTAIVPDLGVDREVCGDFELTTSEFYPGATYAWSTGVNSQSIMITEPGTYQVDIIDANGCVGSDEVVIGYLDKPVVDLGSDIEVCEGEKVTLHAGNTGSSFLWSTGATTQIIETYTAEDYWVEVTNPAGCMTTGTITVNINAVPQPDFSFVEKCSAEEVFFLNTSVITPFEPLTLSWNFGDGSVSNLEQPVKSYTSPDTYDVTLLVASAFGCEEEVTKEITIHPYPTANFLVKDLCEEEVYQLTNLSSISDDSELSYDWDLSIGNISFEQNPQINYVLSGTYAIELEVTSDFGCSVDVSKSAEVYDLPTLLWPDSVETCDEVILLDANNTGNTFVWNTFETTQTIEVDDSGVYEVTITNANGCSISETITAQFYTVENPTLGDDFASCGSTELTTTVDDVSYQWSTNETSQTIPIDETGYYSLTVTNDELCSSVDEVYVTINEIPDADLPIRVTACQSELPQLDATTDNVESYLWSTGAELPIIDVSEAGTYTVLLISIEGCEKNEIVVVDVEDSPVIEIQDLEKGCDELILAAGTFGESMVWSNGTTGFYSTFEESGVYTLTVSLSNECSAFKEFEVTINESPEVDLGEDSEICFGETVTIYAGDETNTYLWTDLSVENTITVGSEGVYMVEATNEFECSAVDGVVIDVRPEIEIDLGDDRFVCDNNSGQEFVLDAGIDISEYYWTSSYGQTSNEKSFAPDSLGTFNLTVFDSVGCYAIDEVTLSETNDNITASFLSASIADVGDTIQFAQLTETIEATYIWLFGDGSRSLKESPEHIYYRDGEYEVTMIASNGVCTDTLQKIITVVEGRIEGDLNTYEALYAQINELNLYPNPTREYINIYFELSKPEEVYMQINDLSGTVHHRSRVDVFESTVQIQVSELPSGMYFLTTVIGSTTKRIKFLVN